MRKPYNTYLGNKTNKGEKTMTKISEVLFRRYCFTNTFAVMVALSLIMMVGCATVPINPNDSSPPKVTIKVNGPNGYQEQASVDYGNNTAQQPVEIMCIVEDPQGVKSIDMRFSKGAVKTAYCGGATYGGTWVVGGLPSPVGDTLSGSSGKVPTKLAGIMKISGILELMSKPPKVTETCYPANNTKVVLRCRGGNWSSNAGVSTTTKYLDVNFKF